MRNEENYKLWRKNRKVWLDKNENERKREWYLKNKERISARRRELYKRDRPHIVRSHLKRAYGISIEEYSAIFKNQNGCCAICGKNQILLVNKLSVDHNHITGKVRGLLCPNCNFGIGIFKDNCEFLKKASDYLSVIS